MCGLFLIAGVRKTVLGLETGSTRPPGAFDSTDRYIERLTGRWDGSQRLLKALDGLPANKPIALLVPDASKQAAFVYQIVVYLGWPREVKWVPVKEDTVESQVRLIAPESLAAVIFWGVKPPGWLTEGVQLGPEQVIVPLPEKSEP